MSASRSVRLSAVGDVALGGSLECYADGFLLGSRDVLSHLSESDLVFADLDCTCSGSQGTPPSPDEYLVSAPASQLKLLKGMNVQVVSQANNHSLDFGGEALVLAQAELNCLGIAAVGAGVDFDRAREPLVVQRNGLDIGFLAFASTHPWVGAVPATATSPGVAPMDRVLIEQEVRDLADKVDCLVVSLHWGKEYIHYPPPSHLDLAHDIVAWGARIIIGHHPHVIQGIEEWNDGVICYSLGNFLFPDYFDQQLSFRAECRESLLVTFEVSSEKVRLDRIVPVVMSDDCVLQEVRGDEGKGIRSRLDEYSRQLRSERYERLWAGQIRGHELRRLRRVLKTEVLDVGLRGGLTRLSSLGVKNMKSIGRSLWEIVAGRGRI